VGCGRPRARARAESEREKKRGEPARQRVKKCEAARAAALSLPSSSGSAVRWGALGTTRGPPRVRERTMAEQRQTASSQSAAEPARRTVGTCAFTALDRPSVHLFERSFVRLFRVLFAVSPYLSLYRLISPSSDCRCERVRRVQVISARFSSVSSSGTACSAYPRLSSFNGGVSSEGKAAESTTGTTWRETTRSILLDFSGSFLRLVDRPRTRSTRILSAHGEYAMNIVLNAALTGSRLAKRPPSPGWWLTGVDWKGWGRAYYSRERIPLSPR